MDANLTQAELEGKTDWGKIRVGALVSFRDWDSLMDSTRAEAEDGSDDYFVTSIWRFKDKDNLADWQIFFLKSQATHGDEEMCLVVKTVSKEISCFRYFALQDFQPGNRQVFLSGNGQIFFPEVQGNEPLDKLPYELSFSIHDGGEEDGFDFVYSQKPQGVRYGSIDMVPNNEGWKLPVFSAIVEYFTPSEKSKLPHILLLEIGGVDIDGGGYIQVFGGYEVKLEEVEAVNVEEQVL